ncbi:DUF4132 domain-containing protein [Nocardia sp. NPDC050406]|uniref:DUF4132 domain-containing protein n=1 Tax=Nocardia sp. NPDC050406 TaxID=3364318 RepID=UPI00378EE699
MIEEEWSVPAHWRASAEAFRGINEPPQYAVDPEATKAVRDLLRHRFAGVVHSSVTMMRADGFGEIADAAQRYADAPDAEGSPLGAAAIWAMLDWSVSTGRGNPSTEWERTVIDALVDSWITEFGVGFAAEVVVRRRGLDVGLRESDDGFVYSALHPLSDSNWGGTPYFDLMAQRVRRSLAAAPEDQYRAAVQRLSELRSEPGTVWARFATSYLVPERQDWLDADLLLGPEDGLGHAQPWQMLISSVTTMAQLTRVAELPGGNLQLRPEQIFSLLTQVGPEVVPVLMREFTSTQYGWSEGTKALPGVLAQLPADEPFQALLDRMDDKPVLVALEEAIARYPRRAMRLLSRRAAETGAPQVVRLLRLHAVAHTDLIDEYADPKAKALLNLTRRFPDADPARLPAFLAAPAPKKSKVPRWLPLPLLPQIRLRDSDSAVPETGVAHLITLLASGADEHHPDVMAVAEAADPFYLAEFSWAVFDDWRLAGHPTKDRWALRSLALFATDDTVRRLLPLIREWPSKGGTARAMEGLDVLAAIGSDTALEQLHRLAGRVKQAKLRAYAEEKVAQIGQRLGLDDEQLADRLVPKLGLSRDSTLTLDYGPRQFVVGLDSQLRPSVTVGDTTRRTLPKPAATDDPDLAPLAQDSFRAFTKELKAVTTEQIRRFEGAMVDGRRWRANLFRQTIVDHPVLGQLARRLVWAVFDQAGAVTGSFRIDSDGTFADAEDEPFELAEEALVGVAHPLHLMGALDTWRGVFADYELLQPFEQLERDLHAFTPEEADSNHLSRFDNWKISTGKAYGLRNRGWDLEYSTGYKQFGRHQVVLRLSAGIRGGYYDDPDEQHILDVRMAEGSFGALDPIAASELLRQLERLAV